MYLSNLLLNCNLVVHERHPKGRVIGVSHWKVEAIRAFIIWREFTIIIKLTKSQSDFYHLYALAA